MFKQSLICVVILTSIYQISYGNEVDIHLMKEYVPLIGSQHLNFVHRSHPPINPEKRDELFKQTGINAYLLFFDELEKNVLYLRMRQLSLETINSLYPDIPKIILKATQTTISGEK